MYLFIASFFEYHYIDDVFPSVENVFMRYAIIQDLKMGLNNRLTLVNEFFAFGAAGIKAMSCK